MNVIESKVKEKVFYPTQDFSKDMASCVKDRISSSKESRPVPARRKTKTNVKYQTLPDGKYSGLQQGNGGEQDEDNDADGGSDNETDSHRYYDCFDRCGKCCAKNSACKCSMSARYQTSLMASVGFLISFGIRCNMGIAMIQMTEKHTTDLTNSSQFNCTYGNDTSAYSVDLRNSIYPNVTCNYSTNEDMEVTGLFNWNYRVQGLIESSFFWGYLVTQVPGGYLSSIFPANKVFGCAITISAFLNLFLPTACKIGYVAAIVLRITQGLVEGVTYPACHGIWRFWAPPLERSRLATIAFCGSYAGAVIGLPLSSLLTQYLGWEACFYFYGTLGLIWGTIWWFLSFERPSKHPRISHKERTYIEESLGLADNTVIKFAHTPWKRIFTSMPVYAIIVANICRSWTFYLLIVHQTKYFSDVFNFPIATGGAYGALPHLVMACIVPFGGWLADLLRKRDILSTTNVRKVFNCGGFGLEATFLLVVGFTNSRDTAIVSLMLAVGFSGFAISGYNVNHLDIAPRYASILMGISNGFGTLSGILCPIAVTSLTHNEPLVTVPSQTQNIGVNEDMVSKWKYVFLIAGIIHYLGIIFYGIFASGEKQDWANPIELQEEEAKDNLSRYGSVRGSICASGRGSLYSIHSRQPEDVENCGGSKRTSTAATYIPSTHGDDGSTLNEETSCEETSGDESESSGSLRTPPYNTRVFPDDR